MDQQTLLDLRQVRDNVDILCGWNPIVVVCRPTRRRETGLGGSVRDRSFIGGSSGGTLSLSPPSTSPISPCCVYRATFCQHFYFFLWDYLFLLLYQTNGSFEKYRVGRKNSHPSVSPNSLGIPRRRSLRRRNPRTKSSLLPRPCRPMLPDLILLPQPNNSNMSLPNHYPSLFPALCLPCRHPRPLVRSPMR